MYSIFKLRLLRTFCRELSTLVSSGVSVLEAFTVLSRHAGKPGLKLICSEIRDGLARGRRLDEAMAMRGDFFPPWCVIVVKYSQTGGSLAPGLESIADRLDKDYSSFCKLAVGLAYPVFLFHAAVFLFPVSSLVTKGVCAYFSDLGRNIVPLYIFLFSAWALNYILSRWFRDIYDRFILFVPFAGALIKGNQIAMFINTLRCLTAAGVTMVEGYEVSAESCTNKFMAKRFLRGLAVIKKGGSLPEAFAACDVFTPQTLSMAATAHKSGSIISVLDRIAAYSQKDSETMTNMFLAFFPVFVYIAIAVYIGYRIINFYSGYFSKMFSY